MIDKLIWHEEYDENDNTIWEAAAPYADECGSPFYFRIKQKLEDNKRIFYDASDEDIRGDYRRDWESIDEAKTDLEKDNESIIKSIRYEAEQPTEITDDIGAL